MGINQFLSRPENLLGHDIEIESRQSFELIT